MDTTQNSNNFDFLNEKAVNAPGRIKDMVVFLLFNIHWFVLCAIIGACIGYYRARTQPESFSSSAKIMLKMSGMNRNGAGQENAIINGVAQNYFYSPFTTTINNEIMIITSKTNVAEVVRKLKLNVDYNTDTKYMGRTRSLYGESPVEVDFLDMADDDYTSFSLVLKGGVEYEMTFDGLTPITGVFGTPVTTPVGQVCVRSTWHNNDGYIDIPIRVTHSSAAATTEHYRSAIYVGRDDNANTILNLVVQDHSPIRAADALNTLITVYNEDAVKDKTQIIENTYNFINERIAQLDSDLGVKEGQLASFKQQNQIININALGEASMAKKALHSEEAERLSRQLSLAKYTQQSLTNMDDLSPLMVAFDDPTIAAEVSRYNEIAIKLSKYTTSGATKNPMVVSMGSELKLMKSNINSMLSTYIQTLNTRLGDARNAESMAVQEISAVPYKQVYVSDIERLQEVKSALYLNLLSKREELLISQPSIDTAARIIDEAHINRSPVAPNTRKIILLGILLGLLVPIAFMVLKTFLDTKVRYRRDIEESLSVPMLGEVPLKPRKDDRNVVVLDKGRDVVTEAFRLLRSNVSYMKNADKQCSVFMTTSMMENSGKTFVVTNLASAFAIAGKSVVVIDLDLRKGTLTKNSVGNLDMLGISDWLSGEVNDVADILMKDAVSAGVDLLPSGYLPPNPAELLLHKRLELMVEWLQERYDYIFIDGVPSSIVADSDIVKRVVDATLFIVRSGRIDKRDLPGLQYMYEQGKYPNMGIVLNGINVRKRGYGYGYGYGYGSGYGYGYGYGYGSTKSYGYGYGYGSDKESGKKGKKRKKKQTQ